ncbi:unnamed protein product [Mytilus coruscus]|uniref:Uncharacterized protein n=1 Tax=Mytilus coruscus TaxID=42192 RepID=A0A6J8ERJ5_MYTCO|nr:unnamed protein product [Mytilus coruscus]
MAAHMLSATSLLATRFKKCQHMEEKNAVICVEHRRTLLDVFEDKHGTLPKPYELLITCNTCLPSSSKGTSFEVQSNQLLGDLLSTFNFKHVEFECHRKTADPFEDVVVQAAEKATKQTINAFQLMMAGGRAHVPKKTSSSGAQDCLTRKDELFNDLVDAVRSRKLDFPKSLATTEGKKTQASQSEPGSTGDIVDSIISVPSALEPVHDLSDGMATSYFTDIIQDNFKKTHAKGHITLEEKCLQVRCLITSCDDLRVL